MSETGSDNQTQRVAVTGATGFVGRAVVSALLDRGHTVRALVRDAGKAAAVLPEHDRLEIAVDRAVFAPNKTEGVDRTTGTLRLGQTEEEIRVPSRDEALDGIDAVIHLVGIIREARDGQTFRRVHVELPKRLIDACEAAGVKRYLHMSALGTKSTAPTQYWKTKAEAETLVRRSSLDWTIFRPSLIHGAEGEFTNMLADWVKGAKAPWLFVPYFSKLENPGGAALPPPGPEAPMVQPISVGDVAEAFCNALERDESIGEVYNLVGPEKLSFEQMIEEYRDRVPGAKKNIPIIGLPGQVFALKAWAASLVGLGDLLPFDAGMALMGSKDSVAEGDKARADLGIDPTPFRPALARYASQL